MNDAKSKQLSPARVAAVKKLLTSEQNFQRGTAVTRSCRVENNKGDNLAFIESKNKDSVRSMMMTENWKNFYDTALATHIWKRRKNILIQHLVDLFWTCCFSPLLRQFQQLLQRRTSWRTKWNWKRFVLVNFLKLISKLKKRFLRFRKFHRRQLRFRNRFRQGFRDQSSANTLRLRRTRRTKTSRMRLPIGWHLCDLNFARFQGLCSLFCHDVFFAFLNAFLLYPWKS